MKSRNNERKRARTNEVCSSGAANGDHDRCEAASGTKGADHGIISVSKQEEAWLIQRTRGKAT